MIRIRRQIGEAVPARGVGCGGLLESASLWFGLKSLTILAAILYLGSAIFLSRAKIDDSAEAKDGTKFVVTFAKSLHSVPVVLLTSHSEGQTKVQAVCLYEVSKAGFTVYCDPHPIDRDDCGFSFVVFLV